LESGRERTRLPVTAKMALQTAGRTGGRAGSPQTLVRTHPGSKRRTLYLAAHAFRIHGMADDEAHALLEELTAHATQPRFVYSHRWAVGDLVMWDNRCTMHRGRDYDDTRYRRDMHRTTVRDHASTLEHVDAA